MLRLYVAGVVLVAMAATAAVAVVNSDLARRVWLLSIVAVLLAAEHLFETGVVYEREQRERIGFQEGYLVALALLASPF